MTTSSSTSKIILVDPTGDLLLLLEEPKSGWESLGYISTRSGAGPKDVNNGIDERKIGILVSSEVLARASEVFAAMLKPHFSEGARMARRREENNDSPIEIDLPGDTFYSMLLFCNVIHYKIQVCACRPGLMLLQDLAVLSNKYFCSRSLLFFSSFVLQDLANSASRGDIWDRSATLLDCLFLAFWFENDHMFATISKLVIETCSLKTEELIGQARTMAEKISETQSLSVPRCLFCKCSTSAQHSAIHSLTLLHQH